MQNYVSAKSTAQALQFSEFYTSYFTFSAITFTLTFYFIHIAAHLLPVTTCSSCSSLYTTYSLLYTTRFNPTTATCFILLTFLHAIYFLLHAIYYLLLTTHHLLLTPRLTPYYLLLISYSILLTSFLSSLTSYLLPLTSQFATTTCYPRKSCKSASF
ncbi:hypothetical protein D3C74_381580 [compost metagenome]